MKKQIKEQKQKGIFQEPIKQVGRGVRDAEKASRDA